jgi:uncharacterized damage-inducible protein DinB
VQASLARTLTRYNAWANELIFAVVAALPEGEATKPRRSVFKNMVHTLNHNYVIDRIFQAHLEGRSHGYAARNTPDHPPLAELWRAQQEIDRWYIDAYDAMEETRLAEKIRFSFVGGGEGVMTRGEILQHLVNHTSYHRGFVAQMIYDVPARPPTTDLTVYLRDAAPADSK